MPTKQPLDDVPEWLLLAMLVVAFGLMVETGYRLALRSPASSEAGFKANVSAAAGALFGMAAYLLSVTFGAASGRFDDRRALMLEEANAIGTTYLRTSFLPEDQREEARALLREYVDLRIDLGRAVPLEKALARSKELQLQLWEHGVQSIRTAAQPLPSSLFVTSLNQVIDLENTRISVGGRRRIKPVLWGAFLLIALLAMLLMGYHAGAQKARTRLVGLLVSAAFAVLLILILDLDRPDMKLFSLSPLVMIELRESMRPP